MSLMYRTADFVFTASAPDLAASCMNVAEVSWWSLLTGREQ